MGKKPLFEFFKYCNRCCMPETNEDMKFDEMGICLACQSAEQKIHINWKKREKQLRKIFEKTYPPENRCIISFFYNWHLA